MSYRARAVRTPAQTASITLNASTSGTFTLPTTVDKNYSIIEFIGTSSVTGSNNANINACRVELTSGTTVTAFVNTAPGSNLVVWFKVTEYFPFTMKQAVQHKSNTLSFSAVGANAELYNGGFTTSNTGGTTQDSLGGVKMNSSTAAGAIGGAASSAIMSYCVADWK